jgi:hypothetical protein
VQPTRFANKNILFLYLDLASLADTVEHHHRLADREAIGAEAVQIGG